MSNFNFVAPFYDGLVKLVFGRKLWNAQKIHLHLIRPDDQVLIVGGGTGRILEWLPNCEVTYLEQSSEMLKRAKHRGGANFIQSDFLSWQPSQNFDWVICPFFLDCFEENDLEKCLATINEILTAEGHLIVTDFKISEPRHGLLVKLMLVFFRLTTRLKTRKLLDLKSWLVTYFKPLKQTTFLNGLVFSDLYSAVKK